MPGIRGIWVRIWEIREGMQGMEVGIQGIRVGMQGIRVGIRVYKYLTGVLQGFC